MRRPLLFPRKVPAQEVEEGPGDPAEHHDRQDHRPEPVQPHPPILARPSLWIWGPRGPIRSATTSSGQTRLLRTRFHCCLQVPVIQRLETNSAHRSNHYSTGRTCAILARTAATGSSSEQPASEFTTSIYHGVAAPPEPSTAAPIPGRRTPVRLPEERARRSRRAPRPTTARPQPSTGPPAAPSSAVR
jgi:hypothetical protein